MMYTCCIIDTYNVMKCSALITTSAIITTQEHYAVSRLQYFEAHVQTYYRGPT